MPCYSPLVAWREREGRNPEGSRPLVFSGKNAVGTYEKISLPCGKCLGCQLEKSRQWAIRCVLESQMYSENCFITLTYDNEHLPINKKLNKKHLQDFWKRLRKYTGKKIRYFACGEYGDLNTRPHYHAAVFGWKPSDVILYKQADDVKLYCAPFLEKVWGNGFVTVGDMTFDSAAYIARYCIKKRGTGGASAPGRPFVVMSRRPGIASNWWDRYKNDVISMDRVILDGETITKPPRFFDEKMKKEGGENYVKMKMDRQAYALAHARSRIELRKMEKVAEQQHKKINNGRSL